MRSCAVDDKMWVCFRESYTYSPYCEITLLCAKWWFLLGYHTGIFLYQLWWFCLSSGAAGCVATLLHDAIMNPAEGTVFTLLTVLLL